MSSEPIVPASNQTRRWTKSERLDPAAQAEQRAEDFKREGVDRNRKRTRPSGFGFTHPATWPQIVKFSNPAKRRLMALHENPFFIGQVADMFSETLAEHLDGDQVKTMRIEREWFLRRLFDWCVSGKPEVMPKVVARQERHEINSAGADDPWMFETVDAPSGMRLDVDQQAAAQLKLANDVLFRAAGLPPQVVQSTFSDALGL